MKTCLPLLLLAWACSAFAIEEKPNVKVTSRSPQGTSLVSEHNTFIVPR